LLPLIAWFHVGLRFGRTLRVLRLLAVARLTLLGPTLLLPLRASRGVLTPVPTAATLTVSVLLAPALFTLILQLPLALQKLLDPLERFAVVLTIRRHRRLLAWLRIAVLARLTLTVTTLLITSLTPFSLSFTAAIAAACRVEFATGIVTLTFARAVFTRRTLGALRFLLLPARLTVARRLLRLVARGIAVSRFVAGGLAAGGLAVLGASRLLLAVARLFALFAGGRLRVGTLLAAGFALGRLFVGGVALLLLLLVTGLWLLWLPLIAGLPAR
jgi:hypothetical protein